MIFGLFELAKNINLASKEAILFFILSSLSSPFSHFFHPSFCVLSYLNAGSSTDEDNHRPYQAALSTPSLSFDFSERRVTRVPVSLSLSPSLSPSGVSSCFSSDFCFLGEAGSKKEDSGEK